MHAVCRGDQSLTLRSLVRGGGTRKFSCIEFQQLGVGEVIHTTCITERKEYGILQDGTSYHKWNSLLPAGTAADEQNSAA